MTQESSECTLPPLFFDPLVIIVLDVPLLFLYALPKVPVFLKLAHRAMGALETHAKNSHDSKSEMTRIASSCTEQPVVLVVFTAPSFENLRALHPHYRP